jgi:hypothetical protein
LKIILVGLKNIMTGKSAFQKRGRPPLKGEQGEQNKKK